MPLSETDLLLRVGMAVLLGGVIGYERELHEQPAGLRTHILVSLAAATFMIVSSQFMFFQGYTVDFQARADPGRIASNVVVGIGFLGGGTIMHYGLQVKGLTTAASLWLVSSLGLAAGSGMFALGLTVLVLSLFALEVLRYLVEAPRKRIVRLRVRVECDGGILTRPFLAEHLRVAGATLSEIDYGRDVASDRSTMTVQVRLPDDTYEEPVLKRLEELPGIRRLETERLET